MMKNRLLILILIVSILALSHGAMATGASTYAELNATQTAAIQITASTNVTTTALTLTPGQDTADSSTHYYINSSTPWQVVASDQNAGTHTGFMVNYTYPAVTIGSPATNLTAPFMVNSDVDSSLKNLYNLPTIHVGAAAEESTTRYTLSISQHANYADPVLPTNNYYRIVVLLTATNLP